MSALVHTETCTGVLLEHFGAPEREDKPWPHTTRCTGCGAQRVLVLQPTRDTYALTSPPIPTDARPTGPWRFA